MWVVINGKKGKIENTKNLNEIIKQLFKNQKGMIVELNGQIINENNWETKPVKHGDRIEVIQLVGGG